MRKKTNLPVAAANKGSTIKPGNFYEAVAAVIRTARANVYRAVNFTMVEAYWQVGRMIVEEEQQGKRRAQYGKFLIKNLSLRLTKEFGKGFTEANLLNFRQFYVVFPSELKDDNKIPYAVRRELNWTHYRALMRIENEKARAYYLKEAAEQNWSSRALERQINSFYYERILASRNKESVREEMRKKTLPLRSSPEDFIKDPYVLEFLGLKDNSDFHESELEQAIINKLQTFLLELGKGFAFVGRQKHISTETSEFYIDLVFYNYVLKCFVLIDLKSGKLTHQDIGQMDMYVRLFEDTVKGKDDNPTVGLILCAEKDHTIVKYSVLNENKRLFAAKYKLYLPSEEELIKEIEYEKSLIRRDREEES